MPRIALATHAAAPGITADDALLAEALRARGATADAVPWDDPAADWSSYALVVVRSTWDYHLRAAEFERWIGALEQRRVPLMNPPAVLRWNGNKRYLLELEQRGVAIVPTEVLAADDPRASPGALRATLERNGWTDAVVKPVVSASGHGTWRTSLATAGADEGRFAALRASSPAGVLVQPFVPEIVTDGEWSLVFIGGRFSHAAIKRARAGEFRVQSEHGGSYAPATAPPSLVADAERAVVAAAACAGVSAADVVYARVDGVATPHADGARLLLMELECLEPNLFFLQAPAGAERMADALIARVLAPVSQQAYLR